MDRNPGQFDRETRPTVRDGRNCRGKVLIVNYAVRLPMYARARAENTLARRTAKWVYFSRGEKPDEKILLFRRWQLRQPAPWTCWTDGHVVGDAKTSQPRRNDVSDVLVSSRAVMTPSWDLYRARSFTSAVGEKNSKKPCMQGRASRGSSRAFGRVARRMEYVRRRWRKYTRVHVQG